MGAFTGVNLQSVKGRFVCQFATELFQAFSQDGGEAGHALGNALQTFRAVIDRVHAGDHRG